MGTTAEKLARVKETKAGLKAVLVSKSAEVTDATPFRDYPRLFRELAAGGTVELDDLTVTPTGKTFTKYPSGDGYSSVTIKGDANLTEENLPKGLTIYGVAGASPMLALPEQYREYVDYARANLYAGDYAHLVVWDSGDWLAVSFLMDDFTITSYDPETTEIKATGWHTCGYTLSTGAWTSHDYTTEASTGGNYAKHIKFASCYVTYGGQTLFPVGMGAGLAEQWETVFEGEVRTYQWDEDYGTIGSNTSLSLTDEPLFTESCIVRLTVDGVATMLSCTVNPIESQLWGTRYAYYIGNAYLDKAGGRMAVDTGYDYYFEGGYVSVLNEKNLLWFYSRYAGTYNVKLEKAVSV